MTNYVFTSVNSNYLQKARVLAQSVKKFHPQFRFCLLLVEAEPPVGLKPDHLFDEIICLPDLDIPNLNSWMFKHTVVEACTAVKGRFLASLLSRNDCENAIYLDPDIVVFSQLNTVQEALKRAPIVLTPHSLAPDVGAEDIMDNEVGPLRHGVFNLGFVACRADEEGIRFAQWWRDRLNEHCYSDIDAGIFTDQRWVNLAPAFFRTLEILRDPACNVATWNINNRPLTGCLEQGYFVGDQPLRFYHFTGFDSGEHHEMLKRYRQADRMFELHEWYQNQCAQTARQMPPKAPWHYDLYDDGEKIPVEHRVHYRNSRELVALYPNPYSTQPKANSFRDFAQASKSGGKPKFLQTLLKTTKP